MSEILITRIDDNTDDTLQHYGVLGMKWGVRKFKDSNGVLTPEGKEKYNQYKKDRKSVKTTVRHVSAGARNLKERGKAQDTYRNEYDRARKDLRRANGKIYAPWNKNKKRVHVQNATDRVTESAKNWERTKAELNRANRIYDADVIELRKKVNSMVTKYGSESVKSISTKTKSLGEHYVKDVVKTGPTIANIPILGTKYTARYIYDKEYGDRQKGIDENAKRNYY